MTGSGRFNVVHHEHFDPWLIEGATELILSECADGQWFITSHFGDDYDKIPGIVRGGHDLKTVPRYYSDRRAVLAAACAFAKQVFPNMPESELAPWLEQLGEKQVAR